MKIKDYVKSKYSSKMFGHVKLVKKYADEIVSYFEREYIYDVDTLTPIEMISIKYACYLHDIGKIICKDNHDKIGVKLFEKYIWYDIKFDLKNKGFKKDDRKKIKKNISCAIACHKKWKGSKQDIGNIYVSMVVYASDKMAHISKDYSWDSYWNASLKIYKRIKKIQKHYGRTSKFDVLCSCIIKTLLDNCPS